MSNSLSDMFKALPGPEADPLADVTYSGDLEADCLAEFEALQTAFVDRRRQEDRRFRDATDSEYWVAVCFSSRAEKEAFLRAIPGPELASDKYVNGRELAHRLNLEMEV